LAEVLSVVVVGVIKVGVSVTRITSGTVTEMVICGGGPGGVLVPEPFSASDCT
jgi:hypothetical protein